MKGTRETAIAVAQLSLKNARQLAPTHEMSGWLRQQLARLHYAMITGRLTSCGHAGLAVAGGFVELWAPVRVYCLACYTPALIPGSDEDKTCDRCGALDPEGVHQGAFIGGTEHRPITVMYGLCGACNDKEVGTDG
nr:hypothetical protein [Propionibacterium sp.]